MKKHIDRIDTARRCRFILLTSLPLIVLALTACIALALETGAPQMDLEGGSRGRVPFPHQAHQQTLTDCQVCHAVFAQKTGAIKAAVDAGELKKKEVMNKQCIKCHRERKRAGQPSGPTSCTQCHKR